MVSPSRAKRAACTWPGRKVRRWKDAGAGAGVRARPSHTPRVVPIATSAATTGGAVERRRPRPTSRDSLAAGLESVLAPSRAKARSRAVWKRSSGDFSRERRTTRTSPAGSPGPLLDALVVGGGKSAEDLDAVLDRLPRGERAGRETVAQRLPLKQLRDDVGRAVVVPDVVDGDDVGVAEERGGLGLVFEAEQAILVGRHVGEENLDGDLAGQAKVPGFVDLAHSPLARQGSDPLGADARSRSQ